MSHHEHETTKGFYIQIHRTTHAFLEILVLEEEHFKHPRYRVVLKIVLTVAVSAY